MCFIIDIEVLDELLKSEKDVFIYYGPSSELSWTLMFPNECSDGGNNLSKAMEGLDTFLADYKGIAGVILSNIQSEVRTGLIKFLN
jgi:hypothetical protein